MSSAIHRCNILGVTQCMWNFSILRSMVAMWMSRRWLLPNPLKFELLNCFFLFLNSWIPRISSSERHVHSDLIVCKENGEKLIYWKENKQWLQMNREPAPVVKGPVIHVDFSLLWGWSCSTPSRCQRRSGATVCLQSWLLGYGFGAFFADQYCFFLSIVAFGCPQDEP